MQHSGINKLSVLAILIISLCLTAIVAPVQQASAAGTKCVSRQFSTKSKNDICVNYIQRMLNINDGSALAIDGSFGPKTKAEVKVYQKAQSIAADGIVGPNTWGKLCAQQAKYKAFAVNAGCAVTTSSTTTTAAKKTVIKPISLSNQRDANHGCDAYTYRQGAKGDCVKAIQRLFNSANAQLDVDGIYGPKTAAIVKAWQTALKVKGDTSGVMGTNTWDSVCFWDGHVPSNGKYVSYDVPDKTMAAWTDAARKAGCNL
jgi:peptidoglycan hydrolase-like protein with peptidoglycan-binding domain